MKSHHQACGSPMLVVCLIVSLVCASCGSSATEATVSNQSAAPTAATVEPAASDADSDADADADSDVASEAVCLEAASGYGGQLLEHEMSTAGELAVALEYAARDHWQEGSITGNTAAGLLVNRQLAATDELAVCVVASDQLAPPGPPPAEGEAPRVYDRVMVTVRNGELFPHLFLVTSSLVVLPSDLPRDDETVQAIRAAMPDRVLALTLAQQAANGGEPLPALRWPVQAVEDWAGMQLPALAESLAVTCPPLDNLSEDAFVMTDDAKYSLATWVQDGDRPAVYVTAENLTTVVSGASTEDLQAEPFVRDDGTLDLVLTGAPVDHNGTELDVSTPEINMVMYNAPKTLDFALARREYVVEYVLLPAQSSGRTAEVSSILGITADGLVVGLNQCSAGITAALSVYLDHVRATTAMTGSDEEVFRAILADPNRAAVLDTYLYLDQLDDPSVTELPFVDRDPRSRQTFDGEEQGFDFEGLGYRPAWLYYSVPSQWKKAELPFFVCTWVDVGWNPCAHPGARTEDQLFLPGQYPRSGNIEVWIMTDLADEALGPIGVIDAAELPWTSIGAGDDSPVLSIRSELSLERLVDALTRGEYHGVSVLVN